jgi:transcription elongation factor SPT4
VEQFELDGCDNCESFLGLQNNRDAIDDCTSSNFDGLVVYCIKYADHVLRV